jgi:hypothetical protein
VPSSTLNLKSPRSQRYLLWVSGVILAVGIAAVLVVFLRNTGHSEPEVFSNKPVQKVAKPEKNIKLEAVQRSLAGKFILTAVQRKRLAEAWPLVGPGIRQGMTYKQWLSGTIPVVPYLDPIKVAPIKVDVANKDYALIEVVILPVSKKVKPQIFTMEMIKVGKGSKSHWVVNSWAPRSVPTIPNNPGGG